MPERIKECELTKYNQAYLTFDLQWIKMSL